ncbi:MAG: hypothetical protein AAGI01_01880 [Myxococcota bacterium]
MVASFLDLPIALFVRVEGPTCCVTHSHTLGVPGFEPCASLRSADLLLPELMGQHTPLVYHHAPLGDWTTRRASHELRVEALVGQRLRPDSECALIFFSPVPLAKPIEHEQLAVLEVLRLHISEVERFAAPAGDDELGDDTMAWEPGFDEPAAQRTASFDAVPSRQERAAQWTGDQETTVRDAAPPPSLPQSSSWAEEETLSVPRAAFRTLDEELDMSLWVEFERDLGGFDYLHQLFLEYFHDADKRFGRVRSMNRPRRVRLGEVRKLARSLHRASDILGLRHIAEVASRLGDDADGTDERVVMERLAELRAALDHARSALVKYTGRPMQ